MRKLRSLWVVCALSFFGCTPVDGPGDATQLALSIGGGTLHVAIGEKAQLQATPADGTGKPYTGVYTITWTSSNTSVARVSSTALLTGAGNGSATITALAMRVDTGATATASITVTVGTTTDVDMASPSPAPIDGGVTDAATSPPTPDAATSPSGSYSSDFNGTENPIVEGGHWVQGGKKTGLDWTDVRTGNGIAYGTQTGSDGYDDSIALLSGFPANQRVSAVIHLVKNRSASTGTHEVELILRGSYTAHTQHLYECNVGYSGASGWYSQIVRLDGPIGTFQDITQYAGPTPDVKDGDVFTAEIVGTTIRTYINGAAVSIAQDSTFSTGQPGIGFFWRGTESITDFAFTSFAATPL